MKQQCKLEVHHGGTFQYISQLIYSNGTVDYVDYVIHEITCWSDIEQMLRDLGYEREDLLQGAYKEIYDDASVEVMFKVMKERSLILMYVEHSPPIPEYSHGTAKSYGIKESRSTAYPEFKAHSNEDHSIEGRSNKTHSNVAHIEEGLKERDMKAQS